MSNYRRSQMERDLPDASPNLCDYLWKNLGEADVRIDPADIKLIGKLISAYVKQTTPGKQTVLKLLNATVAPASILNTYFKAGHMGQEEQKIRPRDLMEFKGWIYKGTSTVKYEAIDIDEREDAAICDCCGGRFPEDYCLRPVESTKRTGEVKNELWCNHCRYAHEDPRIRTTGDHRTCAACEKVICEYNPKHQSITQAPMAQLPQRATSNGGPPLPPGWERP
jgi:hypothetical protein